MTIADLRRAAALAAAARVPASGVALLWTLGAYPRCWASVETLAASVGLSTRQTRRLLRRLEDAGVLDREERPGSTTLYAPRLGDAVPDDDQLTLDLDSTADARVLPRPELEGGRERPPRERGGGGTAKTKILAAAPSPPHAPRASARASARETPSNLGQLVVAAYVDGRRRAGDETPPPPTLAKQLGSMAKRCHRDGTSGEEILAGARLLGERLWGPGMLPTAIANARLGGPDRPARRTGPLSLVERQARALEGRS